MDTEVVAIVSMLRNTIYIDDIIADEGLDKRRQSLLAISGRHRDHCLWLLTQSYSAIIKKSKMAGYGHICLVPKRKSRS